MITLSRTYFFSAAHRVEGHSKCGRLHGHNYEVVVQVDSDEKNDGQLVLDCVKMDSVVQPFIDSLDGYYLISQQNMDSDDPYVSAAINCREGRVLNVPTSSPEHIAEYLAKSLQGLILGDVVVMVHDTPTTSATYWCGGNHD